MTKFKPLSRLEVARDCLDEIREQDRELNRRYTKLRQLVKGAVCEYSGLKQGQVVEVIRNGFTCFTCDDHTALNKGTRYTVVGVEFRPLTELRRKAPRLHLVLRTEDVFASNVVVLCTAKQLARYFKVVKPAVTL